MIDNVTTVVGAWLFFLLMNAADLKIVIKREDQRTEDEKRAVREGLLRLMLLEFLLLVPASAGSILLVMPAFTRNVSALAILTQGSDRDSVASM